MDSPDDDADIRLQRVSGDLLADFDASLAPFLWRGASDAPSTTSGSSKTVRTRVRARAADRLVGLLEPFQELPQLLDSRLARWLPQLADAFLASVAGASTTTSTTLPATATATHADALVVPLQAAVARLLYTFCKVRGEKVVVGFLPVETRHLERLLGALEQSSATWTWEERYVVLLWLAQLLLAPFDLATISTGRAGDEEGDEWPVVDGFAWPGGGSDSNNSNNDNSSNGSPQDLPSIVVRIIPLAVRYLAAPGKERDAARTLLVRLAMRRDMQQLGVRHALVQWALASLRPSPTTPAAPPRQPYYYIGTLAFLAGILAAAAGASDMDDALAPIFAAVHAVADEETETAGEGEDKAGRTVFQAIRSSALARKMMIKTVRAVAVRYIQKPDTTPGSGIADTAVETTIGYLLERLADNDTPVRLAASKALSVITLQLAPDMAAQVIDAVLEGLQRNVLRRWSAHKRGRRDGQNGDQNDEDQNDLSAVDPLEWHGLMLTLAHLLYRRAPPRPALADIAAALHLGLAFERRSVSGSATGTNVRDAACFGVWALARRYTTAELQPLDLLQPLATSLVVAACLDPAGNIRRGSSAALQELVGRHPDTVRAGIPLVQAVDYHAVALRARAATDVASRAAALDLPLYGAALRRALLGWRGLSDAGDASARRTAAASFGHIAALMAAGHKLAPIVHDVARLTTRILALQPRQVEERHGLLLALAAVLDEVSGLVSNPPDLSALSAAGTTTQLRRVLEACQTLAKTATARRPELLAEAASRLVVSSFPLLQAQAVPADALPLLSGPALLEEASSQPASFRQRIRAMEGGHSSSPDPELARFAALAADCLASAWLGRPEPEVVAAASDAALVLLVAQSAPDARRALVQQWADIVRRPSGGPRVLRQSLVASATQSKAARVANKSAVSASSSRSGGSSGSSGSSNNAGAGSGYVFALIKAYPVMQAMQADTDKDNTGDVITRAILDRWAADRHIDTRVALLQALAQTGGITSSSTDATPFHALLAAGLDDYTTDARGDVGSHVRLQALRATQVLWESSTNQAQPSTALFLRVLRLAAEKLDRVRTAAQTTLAVAVGRDRGTYLLSLTFSSHAYFGCLLGLRDDAAAGRLGPIATAAASTDAASSSSSRWDAALMRGFVTSADTGNEELVIASRAALVAYVTAGGQDRRRRIWQALARNLPSLPSTTATAATAATTATAPPPRPPATPPDRIVIPTLEIVAFLFDAGVFFSVGSGGGNNSHDGIPAQDRAALARRVHRAADKPGSVRKLEACVKVCGALAAASSNDGDGDDDVDRGDSEPSSSPRALLAAWLQHPWPRVRTAVVDALWVLGVGQPGEGQPRFDALKGVDWGTADADAVATLTGQLGLVQ